MIFFYTCNEELLHIKVWFTDQNNKPLETEDRINLTLVIKECIYYEKASIFGRSTEKLKNWKISAIELQMESPAIFGFLNLCKIPFHWLSEKINFTLKIGLDLSEFLFDAIFSVFKTFFAAKSDIQSNWGVTNSYIWHYSISAISYYRFKCKFGTRSL